MADSKKYDGSTWEHSLRKMTTATAEIEPTIYTDGTAITSYTIKGNTVQNGTPAPSNPVMPNGVGERTENLFPPNISWYRNNNSSALIKTDDQNDRIKSDIIPISDSYSYLSINMFNPPQIEGWYLVSIRFYGDDLTTPLSTTGSGNTRAIPTGAKWYCLLYGTNTGYIDDSTKTALQNAQIIAVYGSTVPTSYEPYGYKIPISTPQGTSNIYLSEPLYKIGNYADVINADGTITRNIGHIKLSSLTWSDYAANQFASTQSIDKIYGSGVDTMLCDTYICAVNRSTLVNNAIAPWNSSTSNRLVVQDNQYSTAADWIAAMGDVGIWFILATPTTEQITLPTIPTADGANTITVDTTVQPSEFSATWSGWHNAYVKEYDGSDWQ